ncbi:MAG: MFS transporter [Chthoniobacteraceae bacterium]
MIGVFYGAAFTWVCVKVKEGSYPPPPEIPPSEPQGERAGAISRFKSSAATYFRECFTHSYYISIFIMSMVAGLTFSPINTFSVPFATSLGVDMNTYGKALAATYLISLCLSFFLGWLADLFHPLRMAMAMLLGYGLVATWGAFYATSAKMFLIAWVMHGVLSGCYFTSAASLGQRLYPQSRFAQFASASAIVGALFGMVLAPAVGLFIDSTDRIYRYTFGIAAVMAFVALGCAFFVYGKFKKLGGPRAYMAPE